MGDAILSAWKKNPTHGANNFYVIKPSAGNDNGFYKSIGDFPPDINPDIIIYAAKPQQIADILPVYKKHFGVSPLYISIAAGKTIGSLSDILGDDARIVRAMPNTPALIGKAVTTICANINVADEEKEFITLLMGAFGKTLWIEEEDMNAATAVAGSGPAYVLLFLEALTEAGIKSGLKPEDAKLLACGTLHGTIHLAEKSDKSFLQLRENVTSKGGTTEAALNVLMGNDNLKNLISQAVAAAVRRAEDLA